MRVDKINLILILCSFILLSTGIYLTFIRVETTNDSNKQVEYSDPATVSFDLSTLEGDEGETFVVRVNLDKPATGTERVGLAVQDQPTERGFEFPLLKIKSRIETL